MSVALFLDVFTGSCSFCPLTQIFSAHLEFYIECKVMWNIHFRIRSGGSFLNMLVIYRYFNLFCAI